MNKTIKNLYETLKGIRDNYNNEKDTEHPENKRAITLNMDILDIQKEDNILIELIENKNIDTIEYENSVKIINEGEHLLFIIEKKVEDKAYNDRKSIRIDTTTKDFKSFEVVNSGWDITKIKINGLKIYAE